jgi:hypothetical protein
MRFNGSQFLIIFVEINWFPKEAGAHKSSGSIAIGVLFYSISIVNFL